MLRIVSNERTDAHDYIIPIRQIMNVHGDYGVIIMTCERSISLVLPDPPPPSHDLRYPGVGAPEDAGGDRKSPSPTATAPCSIDS
ncbi:hypothetical protein TNCV_4649301 [Trichonephila clavipes]|uniref:Uncharacterized protein n=1 Tax=Trichonephila clavipes TaxID=2585209 RepID=A0A8X6T6F3_TRICX|nr:hypothetical protein TNCV_4649301 [Trichonephila clavipes]